MQFRYDSAILETFPNIRGGVILATNLTNGPSNPELTKRYRLEQQSVLAIIGDTPLSEIDSLAAWRRAFTTFGVKPTQYRSAAEALLRRLTKKGDIPSLNTLVDIGNLVSIRYGLPVAIFDTRATTGPVTVRFSDGDEFFTTLGNEEIEQPVPGEVIFVDQAGLVSARRWCWRQSEQSAANENTTSAIITVEGHHENAAEDVQSAVDDLIDLLEEFAGTPSFPNSGILSPKIPSIDDD